MTHIAVLGAGVIGVTTAWYLNQAGFQVTVIERESIPATQTSFANGGQISVSHAMPWANPTAPMNMLKSLFNESAPLLYRIRGNNAQLSWTMQFLKNCDAKSADANLVQMVRLGLYSRKALQDLRASLNLEYNQQTRGILHVYTNQKELHAAIAPTEQMRELGCDRKLIDINTALSIEPALYPIARKLVGATYTSEDESGDAHIFTVKLAEHCRKAGVKFLYDTEVLALNASHAQQSSEKSDSTMSGSGFTINNISIQSKGGEPQDFEVDGYVVALGCYSPKLTKPIGIDLPILPIKGYSVTYQVNPKAPHLAPTTSLIDDEYKLVTSRLGDKLRVAGTAEFNGYNLDLNQVRCQALHRRSIKLFSNGIIADSAKYWTGLRPMTPSNIPLIGRAHLGKVRHGSGVKIDTRKSVDNLWLNTGHGTLGWTHACGSAKALSLLMLEESPDLDFDFIG